MAEIRFVWDGRKAEANRRKHGVAFPEGVTVFADPNARLIADRDHSGDEDRFVILVLSSLLRLLVVCHCYREDDLEVRIISARRATKAEERKYRGFLR